MLYEQIMNNCYGLGTVKLQKHLFGWWFAGHIDNSACYAYIGQAHLFTIPLTEQDIANYT
jgi:hypothetical protein